MSTGPTLLIGMGLGLVIAATIVEITDKAREQGAEQAISTHYENLALEAGCAAYDTKTGELVWKEITNDEQ